MQSEMFNMVKAVVGVGVLSLPAGKFLDTLIAINITHHHHTFDGVSTLLICVLIFSNHGVKERKRNSMSMINERTSDVVEIITQ